MRIVMRILFSLRVVSSGLETDGIHEFIEIINDALIEPIKLRTLLLLKFLVSGDRRQETGSQRRVDPFEQLQEYQADGVTVAQQAIAPRPRDFFDEPFGAKLR